MGTDGAAPDPRPAPPGRRGRPPRGEATLSRDAILRAALAVIDADGITAVSMRSVARRLGVDAKSLYNHVSGKDDLLDALAEHVLGQLRLPTPTGSLKQDLRNIADAFRRSALQHPHAATLVLTRQLSSFAGLAPIAAVLQVLRDAGCAPDESVHLLRTLLAAVVGTLLREVTADPGFGATGDSGTSRRQSELQASGLPVLVESAPHLARFDSIVEWDFTVTLFTDAVANRLSTSVTTIH